MLLTNTQVSRLRKVFANGSSANIKLSKTQLLKIGQSGEFLSTLLEALMKNVLKLLAKATDVAIHKKIFGSGRSLDLALRATTLAISNEEMNDIIKIIKSLEESSLKVLVKQLKMKQKNKKLDFLECYKVH